VWDFNCSEYRIKPEQVEAWALLDENGCVNAFYQSEVNARFYADKAVPSFRVVRMLEAPEQES
jgi:hypothetical protein